MVVVQARIHPLSLRVPVDAEVGDFIATLCVVNVTSARQPEFFLKDDGGGRVTLRGASLYRGSFFANEGEWAEIVVGVRGVAFQVDDAVIILSVTGPRKPALPPDAVPPTITSSPVASVAENAALALSLTASEAVTWTFNGGADQGLFDLSGATLRWLGNSTKNYEAPDDANSDNVYQVVVRATNVAGNYTDQAVSVTVRNVLEKTLGALTLSTSTIAENSVAGAVVGAIQGATAGSTLSLTDTAGGRFALSGTNIVAGATATDYETATSHSITLRETNADATNSPRDTVLSITVTNVLEKTLGALSLSASTIAENSVAGAVVGAIQGATAGSTLSLTDTAGGRFALSGTNIVAGATATDYETATSHSITLREVIADSTNSPRDTVLSITVTNVTEPHRHCREPLRHQRN
jgi:hypothetical protein